MDPSSAYALASALIRDLTRQKVNGRAVPLWAPADAAAAPVVRRLRQDQIAVDLRGEPNTADAAWLDADFG